jgi:HK97 family phage prohead protease
MNERYITHEGDEWVVHAEDGKVLGKHKTKADAEAQLEAVEAHKHKEDKATPGAGPEVQSKSISDDSEKRCFVRGLELRNHGGKSEGPGTLVGYTAVFDRFSGDLGGFREKIAPGAFRAVLGQDVRALVNHDSNMPLGRTKSGTCRMVQDNIGLRVEIDLPDTQVGRDTATMVRRGDLDGMSFSFVADRDSWNHNASPPERTLESIRDLYDVGPVYFPAYADTSAAMRSLDKAKPAPKPDPAEVARQIEHYRARLRVAAAY